MHRRYNLVHLVLAGVIVLGLMPLMVCLDAQARIAFESDRDWDLLHWEIYVMDADGGNQRNLSNTPGDDRQPSWSPDGKRIAFMSDRDGHVNIHDFPNYEIYVTDADGGNPRNLTNDLHDDRSPSWSPDGKRIVFSSTRDMDRREAPHNIEIYVMDADGGNQQRLTNNLTEDEYPSWSPDGKRIAFMADRKGDVVNWDIYVMEADGGNQLNLTENRVYDSSPSWSPDGKRIAFFSFRDENTEIYVMDADGGNQQNLTNHPDSDSSPAWLNSPFSVSAPGKKSTMWGRLKQTDR